MKHVKKVVVITLLLTVVVLVVEMLPKDQPLFVTRNGYGEGEKEERVYLGEEEIVFPVEERMYTVSLSLLEA